MLRQVILVTYELKLPSYLKIHWVFYVSLLRSAVTSPLDQEEVEPTLPRAIEVEGSSAYRVKRFLQYLLD